MCKIVLLILFNFIPYIVFSQEIESYRLSIDAIYLPSINRKSEVYLKEKNKLVHEAILYSSRKEKLEPIEVQKIIYQLDSLTMVNEFRFEVEQSTINDMKNKYIQFKRENKISNTDIDNFFKYNPIILRTKYIKHNLLDALVGQIDGAYYDIDLKIKYKGHEFSRSHSFKIKSSGARSSELKQWLILYSIYKDNEIFETILLKDICFKKENFQIILFQFLMWERDL